MLHQLRMKLIRHISTWPATLQRYGLSKVVIFFFAFVAIFTNFNNNNWKKKHGVVVHDVISYYSYLPAAIIYQDLRFNFLDDDPAAFAGKIIDFHAPNGGHYQKMTMGLAFLYLPFFLLGHLWAWLSGAPLDGFSEPYMFALLFAAVFYVAAALWVLRKLLLQLVPDATAALVLFALGFGTNLFFYTTLESAMSHAFNFSLFTFFICLTVRWHQKATVGNSLLTGLVYGLISLIRPTNALVVLFFLLYDFTSFQAQFRKFFGQWKNILLIVLMSFVVIFPQLLFWKLNTGDWLFYSYGKEGFFFDHPQIWRGLFSYRKGWLLYTPIMLFGVAGLFFLRQRFKAFGLAIPLFFVLNIYVIFSWWDWTYGGSFGSRPLIDSYAMMGIAMAAVFDRIRQLRPVFTKVLIGMVLLLSAFNLFQTAQYKYAAIHFAEMSKAAYWHSFGKLGADLEFFDKLSPMNYDSLIAGKYVVDPKVRLTIGPDAYTSFEKLNRFKTKILAEARNYEFNQPETQTTLQARSGSHAILLSGDKAFAASIDFWVKPGEEYVVSVWKKPAVARASLVMAAPDPQVLYLQQEVATEIDSLGWGLLTFKATIPEGARAAYRVYVWNKAADSVFFDELRISKVKAAD